MERTVDRPSVKHCGKRLPLKKRGEKRCFFFYYYLATSTTRFVICALVEIHHVRRLFFGNYQRCTVYLNQRACESINGDKLDTVRGLLCSDSTLPEWWPRALIYSLTQKVGFVQFYLNCEHRAQHSYTLLLITKFLI